MENYAEVDSPIAYFHCVEVGISSADFHCIKVGIPDADFISHYVFLLLYE